MANINNNTRNWIKAAWYLVGVVLVIAGFILLGKGPAENPLSLTVAPLVLVFAYLVVIPIAILWPGAEESEKAKGD